ncbi:hypothetical protein L1049_026213 [Liquidambar formosana]|uniref:Uncharacterized protein n=1 Tax=Liquidambar formosana TaxID=63359 RepID=A0AAP0R8W9_LIQFO
MLSESGFTRLKAKCPTSAAALGSWQPNISSDRLGHFKMWWRSKTMAEVVPPQLGRTSLPYSVPLFDLVLFWELLVSGCSDANHSSMPLSPGPYTWTNGGGIMWFGEVFYIGKQRNREVKIWVHRVLESVRFEVWDKYMGWGSLLGCLLGLRLKW